MNRLRQCLWIVPISWVLVFNSVLLVMAQGTRGGGTQPGYGQIIAAKDLHHDTSKPLRSITPKPASHNISRIEFHPPQGNPVRTPRSSGLTQGPSGSTKLDSLTPDLANGQTGLNTIPVMNEAGLGLFFNGPQGSFTPATNPSDATGAIGTTQYLQWVDDSFAVFDKVTGNALYGPAAGNTIWSGFGGACEADNDGQPTVNFDKLAQRWVVSQYAMSSGAPYLQCVAVSTTSDATGTWNRYSFQTGGYENNSFINKNAKLGVWPDGYYMAFDMYSGSTFEGDRLCAFQRANMIAGSGAGVQCVQLEPDYFGLVVSDLDGLTPPPAGAPAYFAAEDSYVFGIDFWKFHVDWSDFQNSTLSLPTIFGTGNPASACSPSSFVGVCVPQYGTSVLLDSYAGRLTGRMPYRNYSDHQSLFATETDGSAPTSANGPAAPTAVHFYEWRINSAGNIVSYQSGTFAPDATNFRFLPSIASDRAGNVAVAYNLSSSQTYPGQYVASRAAGDSLNTLGNETLLNPGNASQTVTSLWDERATLTVDPVDDCTYWYTQQYIPQPGSTQWVTLIAGFYLQGCQVSTVSLNTVPSGLAVNLAGTPEIASASGQFLVGSSLAIGTVSPQAGKPGTQYVFSKWSDGGALNHNITVPNTNITYTASFGTQYELTTAVSPAGAGTVTPASGQYYNAGAIANLTATPAPGYSFTKWTGAVANPASASTTIGMSAPQTVTATFAPLPTWVKQSLIGQSGPSKARVWTFGFVNQGPGQANNIVFNSFKLTQTSGAACTPVVLTSIPAPVGSLAPGQATTGSVTINFSSCPSNALFSLTTQNMENGGASHATLNLSNLSE